MKGTDSGSRIASRASVCVVLLLVGSAPSLSRAQAETAAEADSGTPSDMPARVRLLFLECEATSLEGATLTNLLRAEMRHYGVQDVSPAEEAPPADDSEDSEPGASATALLTLVPLSCVPGSSPDEVSRIFEVTIARVGGEASVTHRVDLSELSEGAVPRSLTAAVAERIRASWVGLQSESEADSEPDTEAATEPGAANDRPEDAEQPAPSTDEGTAAPQPSSGPEASAARGARPRGRPRAETRSPTVAGGAAFVVRSFVGGDVAPLGLQLFLDVPLMDRLIVRVDAEAAQGRAFDRLGTIDLGYLTGGVSLAAVAALGEKVLLSLGPRVSAGLARARGRATAPDAEAGVGTGPLLVAGGTLTLDVLLAGPLSLRFGVEASGVIVGYDALVAGVRVAGLNDGVLSAWLGFALAP